MVGAFVIGEGFLKTILPVVNIAHIVIEAGDAPDVPQRIKNNPCALGGGEGAIIFADQDQRLDGVRQGARGLFFILQRFEQPKSLLIKLQRLLVLSRKIQGVAVCSQTQAQGFIVAQVFRQKNGSLCQSKRALRIYSALG